MVISKSLLLGGVMVLGDFNAHLGRMGGVRDWVPEHARDSC